MSTQKPFIVVADGFDPNLFEQLQKIEQFNIHPQPKVTPQELSQLLPKIDAIVIRSATNITPEILAHASKLQYVIRAGEGTDNIDKPSCEAKGVKVSNTPGANNNSAAEHAIALMMTVLRKTAQANQVMHNKGWDKNKFTGNELTGKKIGIIGFGRIGQIVAKRLAGFEPEIIFYDPFIKESNLSYARASENLAEIFSQCDIISLHTPLMDGTRGFITKELLNLIPKHGILINASRGGIVDEEALFELLKSQKIRGAGFDVFAVEPLPPESKLRELDNLVLTPHVGASTDEAQVRVGEMVVHQLKEFFLNQNLLNEVRS